MRKMPTVLTRDPEDMSRVTGEVHPDAQWVIDGEGVALRKWDGTCVLIRRDGLAVHAFTRREVKRGKPTPPNFISLGDDPATGKIMGWEPAEQSGFRKYLAEAVAQAEHDETVLLPGTYELVGPAIGGNPEGFDTHRLISHDQAERFPNPERFDVTLGALSIFAIAEECKSMGWEGVVWHHPDGRRAKIKAKDAR